MPNTNRAYRVATGVALALSLLPGASAFSQTAAPAAIPSFPPGADYAGVSGTHAENERLNALCGANRNAKDGYDPKPLMADQTKAPQIKSKAGFNTEVVASLDRSVGLAFLPNGDLLVSQRAGGLRTVSAKGVVSAPIKGAPRTHISLMAVAASAKLVSFTTTNSWGSLVWSMISTVLPSAAAQIVRVGLPLIFICSAPVRPLHPALPKRRDRVSRGG